MRSHLWVLRVRSHLWVVKCDRGSGKTLSTGQKIKNRTPKYPETVTKQGFWVYCVKPLLGGRFKLFVLYLGKTYINSHESLIDITVPTGKDIITSLIRSINGSKQSGLVLRASKITIFKFFPTKFC
jgi:hypothetical protein